MKTKILKTKTDIYIFDNQEPIKKGTICEVNIYVDLGACIAIIQDAYIVPSFQFSIGELDKYFEEIEE